MEEPQDQNSLLKQKYLQAFFAKYTDVIQYVNSLPIHVKLKENAVTRLDEGMFWVREGIVHLQPAEPQESISEPVSLE